MAHHRHKRDTNARHVPKATVVAGSVAVLLTVPAVAIGVLTADPASSDLLASGNVRGDFAAASAQTTLSLKDLDRDDVSRSGGRDEDSVLRSAQYILGEQSRFDLRQARAATQKAIRGADTKLWTTAPLNLWTDPTAKAEKDGEVKAGQKVLVTGRRELGRVEIVWEKAARWITEGYLSEDEPTPGIGGACTNGTSVSGSANIIDVHRAVCAAFPTITSYGTYRAGSGDHASGRAVDIMVSGSLGWDVANFVRAHYAELGVSYVIYSQHIWSLDRGGEGWRAMSDRGSTTANHYDHVHVSTY